MRIDGLCKAYGATINPVREALNRLTSEGLVTQEDQRGFSVAPISLEDWRDVVRARCLMEGCALGEAIRHRDEAWEERVVVALHWLSRTSHWSADEKTANPEWGPGTTHSTTPSFPPAVRRSCWLIAGNFGNEPTDTGTSLPPISNGATRWTSIEPSPMRRWPGIRNWPSPG